MEKTKNLGKRFLSMLLAVIMFAAMLPVMEVGAKAAGSVFNYEEVNKILHKTSLPSSSTKIN